MRIFIGLLALAVASFTAYCAVAFGTGYWETNAIRGMNSQVFMTYTSATLTFCYTVLGMIVLFAKKVEAK